MDRLKRRFFPEEFKREAIQGTARQRPCRAEPESGIGEMVGDRGDKNKREVTLSRRGRRVSAEIRGEIPTVYCAPAAREKINPCVLREASALSASRCELFPPIPPIPNHPPDPRFKVPSRAGRTPT